VNTCKRRYKEFKHGLLRLVPEMLHTKQCTDRPEERSNQQALFGNSPLIFACFEFIHSIQDKRKYIENSINNKEKKEYIFCHGKELFFIIIKGCGISFD
jgi:hypothetical protein